MANIFHKFHICLSYLRLKKQTHCTYMWWYKHVQAQREDHVATRLPPGADTASKVRGAISVKEIYFTTLLWQNSGRKNGL